MFNTFDIVDDSLSIDISNLHHSYFMIFYQYPSTYSIDFIVICKYQLYAIHSVHYDNDNIMFNTFDIVDDSFSIDISNLHHSYFMIFYQYTSIYSKDFIVFVNINYMQYIVFIMTCLIPLILLMIHC